MYKHHLAVFATERRDPIGLVHSYKVAEDYFPIKKFKTALNMSKNLRDLSMDGAARYFEVMLKPIITYGIEVIWEDLKQNDLELIDKRKCSY